MEERRRFLTCPICYLEFDTVTRIPLSLLCGHTACKECLTKPTSFTCPMDGIKETRTLTEIPVLQLIYEMIDEFSANPKTQHLSVCPFHKRILDLFCRDCEITFCVKCLGRHKTHEYLDIDQSDSVVKQLKETFSTFYLQTKSNSYKSDEYIQNIARSKAEVQKKQKSFKTSLRCQYSRIHEKIDKKLVQDLDFIDSKAKPIFSYLTHQENLHNDILEEQKYFEDEAVQLKKELDSLPNNLSILNHYKRYNRSKSPIKPSEFETKRAELEVEIKVDEYEVESMFYSTEELRYYNNKTLN